MVPRNVRDIDSRIASTRHACCEQIDVNMNSSRVVRLRGSVAVCGVLGRIYSSIEDCYATNDQPGVGKPPNRVQQTTRCITAKSQTDSKNSFSGMGICVSAALSAHSRAHAVEKGVNEKRRGLDGIKFAKGLHEHRGGAHVGR